MHHVHPVPWVLFGLAISIVGCSSGDRADGPATTTSTIIGGAEDNGDPSVVLLVSYAPGASTFVTCTASVVAPTVLLTAAHCVDAPNHPGHTFGVFLGADAMSFGSVAEIAPHLVAVREVHAHPAYEPSTQNYPADVGAVVLQAPVALSPLPFNRAPLDASIAGKPARIVGYGQTVYTLYNARKFAASTTVVGLDPDGHTLVVGDGATHTCVGDSGGPLLVELGGVATIVGTVSFGPDGCVGASNYQRTDVYQRFIDDVIAKADSGDGCGPPPPPPPDGSSSSVMSCGALTCTCPSIDGQSSSSCDGVNYFCNGHFAPKNCH